VHVLTRRRCEGRSRRREDAIVLNPLEKVETAREDADSEQSAGMSAGLSCAYGGVAPPSPLPRVRPRESAMNIDKCDIDASITRCHRNLALLDQTAYEFQ
jgi:hypothetical protein